MDVHFFFSQRISFIRQLYDTASAPYIERKRKIEAEEEPFVPPYSEDGEPPFLEEWIEADESLHVLAYSCVSMLAAALHLYLESWVKQSHTAIETTLKNTVFKKRGWFAGYNAHFARHFNIAFENSSANLALLEEVVLARNRIEHPVSITSMRSQYADSDLKKLCHPFFINESELPSNIDTFEDNAWFLRPTLHVDSMQLLEAISEVECFVKWFEVEIGTGVYSRRNARQKNQPDGK